MDHVERNRCPKREWTVGALTDDDVRGEGVHRQAGLRFHLSRCSECNALGGSIGDVGQTVSAMGSADLPEGFLERANAAALAAVSRTESGGALPANLEDDLEDLLIARASRPSAHRLWLAPLGAAMAASVVLMFGIGVGSVFFPLAIDASVDDVEKRLFTFVPSGPRSLEVQSADQAVEDAFAEAPPTPPELSASPASVNARIFFDEILSGSDVKAAWVPRGHLLSPNQSANP